MIIACGAFGKFLLEATSPPPEIKIEQVMIEDTLIIICGIHKFYTVDWSIDLHHFCHYCLICLIVHFESKKHQTFAHSACADRQGLADLIMIGKYFKVQHSVLKKVHFCSKGHFKVYINYKVHYGIYIGVI